MLVICHPFCSFTFKFWHRRFEQLRFATVLEMYVYRLIKEDNILMSITDLLAEISNMYSNTFLKQGHAKEPWHNLICFYNIISCNLLYSCFLKVKVQWKKKCQDHWGRMAWKAVLPGSVNASICHGIPKSVEMIS